jgi:hypothetical protein
MTRLECTLENLTKAVEETMTTNKALIIALNRIGQDTKNTGEKLWDAFLTWSVPAGIFVVVWALTGSGVVPAFKQPVQPTTGTHP